MVFEENSSPFECESLRCYSSFFSLFSDSIFAATTSLDAVSLVHDPPYVVTSPNAPFVPYIDLHEPHELRARADGRFGLEDCFQHSQIWSSRHPWAPCILRKPSADQLVTHDLALLWWTPTVKFYELEPGCAFGDLGRLVRRAWEPLEQVQIFLSERFRRYTEHHSIDSAAYTYEFSMRSTLLRLKDQPLSFQDTVGQVAEFQRLCLDVNAMLDFVTIYHPRLSNDPNQLKPTVNFNIMGAFTNDLEVTSKLHHCGIPVWLIRPEKHVFPATKIVSKVTYDAIPAEDEVRQSFWCDHQSGHVKPFPILHIGSGGVDRHTASRQMGSAFVDIAQIQHRQAIPIQSNQISHTLLPTSSAVSRIRPKSKIRSTLIPGEIPSSAAASESLPAPPVKMPVPQQHQVHSAGSKMISSVKTTRHTPCKPTLTLYVSQAAHILVDPQQARNQGRKVAKSKTNGGNPEIRRPHPTENRNVWVDVESDIVPPNIPIWTRALQAVDKNKARVRSDLPPSEKGFTFPDPNSLAGLTPDQYAKKLVAWLSLRPGTCSRAFVSAGRKPPTGSGAVWRSVLNIDSTTLIPDNPCYHADNGKEMKTSKVAAAIKQLFGQELLEKLQAGQNTVFWHDCEMPVENDHIVNLDPNIVREIIWELFEHNFRFEVRALDMIAAPDQWDGADASITRFKTVSQAIGDGFDGKFIIWNDPFPRENEGLRSSRFITRLRPLESLRRLMLSWPDVPASITGSTFMAGMPADLEALEYEVVLFYCQSFFDFFGRPPIVPHYIPLHASQGRP
jgi:hypothetical protein